MAYSAIQERILDLIQQWKVTIYDPAGKYQKDVAHVNDMYRLLEAKGRTTSE